MMPELAKTVDDIETSEAIMLRIDRDAIQKETDVSVLIELNNKDQPKN